MVGTVQAATAANSAKMAQAAECSKQTLLWGSFKGFQVVVANAFTILLHLLAGIAWVQRVFVVPPALLKSKAGREGPVQVIDDSAVVPSGPTEQCKPNQRPTIIIRAVAAHPTEVKPVHLHNEPHLGHNSEAWTLVGPYMRLYGSNAIANSQLFNPEFIHLFVPGLGSLSYIVADMYSRVVVTAIGDPLCHPSKWRLITEMFLKEFPDAFFYHASEQYAQVLHDMGYYINDVGAETTLQIQSWTYGPRTRTVRAAARSAREAGVRVRELNAEELTPEMRRRLQHEVSGDWLQQKAVADRELRIFVRHIDYDNLQLKHGVRIFVAEQFNPATAPPALVDQAIQGVNPNTKPPKPPRNSSLRSLASQALRGGMRSLDSQASGLEHCSSTLFESCNTSSTIWSAANASDGLHSSASLRTLSRLNTPSTLPALLTATKSSLRSISPTADSIGSAASALDAASGIPFAEPAATTAATQPQLVGFVLLDPLWEGGEVIGQVSSICRMKRTAHSGTLKLLYEDVISKLRAEGKQELAFGFAPFFNVRDDRFLRVAHWLRWTSLYLYHFANNLYAFQNLAFSKIRYGAGVDGNKFRDSNVVMSHIYMASKHCLPGMCVLDLYVLCSYVGFMGHMIDTWAKLVGLKKGGANLTGAVQQ